MLRAMDPTAGSLLCLKPTIDHQVRSGDKVLLVSRSANLWCIRSSKTGLQWQTDEPPRVLNSLGRMRTSTARTSRTLAKEVDLILQEVHCCGLAAALRVGR